MTKSRETNIRVPIKLNRELINTNKQKGELSPPLQILYNH